MGRLTIADLINKVKSYSPGANVGLLEKAHAFASRAHQGQHRDSGEDYIAHPMEVAMILAELELDVETIAAGLLHDVLEDTPVTREELQKEFGEEIARLVDGVTKLGRLPFRTKEQQQAENLRKMFLAMAEDLRVVMIKLADRLHNMRTLRHLPEDRQKKIARETLEIYSPLAHRLGMQVLKWELEDLALRYLDPEEYYRLVHKVAMKRKEREGYIQEVVETLKQKLTEMGIRSEVSGRPKHFFSIYTKMKEQGKDFEEIYDLMGVRIIVDTVKDCYAALGMVHSLWKPIPGRFKDYIAMPKSNLYQSLHTTVVGPRGEPLEIQIRTWEMHRTAEYGIAAHWRYKEGYRGSEKEFEEKIAWLRQLLDWQKETRDAQDFLENLKIDLFEDEVFVFTPKGDVKTLPVGSTPVDFAYSVHTDIGHRCIGAKVNGRIVPLNYQLKNGEFVEILTGKTSSPSLDWLTFVKTSRARSKIRQWHKEHRRNESIARGRELLEKEVEKYRFDPAEVLKVDNLQEAARRFNLTTAEDLLAAVGFGRITAIKAIGKLVGEAVLEARRRELLEKQRAAVQGKTVEYKDRGVLVKGAKDLLVRIARCCNPVPGDEIVGYITRGRGVSVHRADCPNVSYLANDAERRIEVSWAGGETKAYPVEIQVEAVDRVNLLTNIMNRISETKTNIEAVNARTTRDRRAVINLVVDIRDVEHMNMLMQQIEKVDGVLAVYRANPT